MQTMHIFAGVGGGLLADLILGHTPIVAIEWDVYACQVLRERAADGWFPDLQVWEGDVRLFDPSEYAGRVGCIHAGFPCQDISVAGKQAGVGTETRSGLYREVLRIASVVRPRYLFLENVAAIVTNGLGTVLADLTALGYDSEWLCLRASDCGANHHRDRWWLLADSQHFGLSKRRRTARFESDARFASGVCRNDKQSGEQQAPKVLADPNGCDDERLIRGGVDSQQWKEPGERSIGLCDGGGRQEWSPEPDVGRVAYGVSGRIHRLKGLGNAQVPIQAAIAWELLGGSKCD